MPQVYSYRNARYQIARQKMEKKFIPRTNGSKIDSLVNRGASQGRTISLKEISRYLDTTLRTKDNAMAATAGTFATPDFDWLTNVIRGTDEFTRLGDSLKLDSIYIRAKVSINPTSLVDTTSARLIIFVDKQNQGVTPTLAQLIQDPTNLYSGQRVDNLERFVILKDKFFNFNVSNFTAFNIKLFKRTNFEVKYTGSTGLPADAGSNNIYSMWWPNTNTAGDLPVLAGSCRLRFAP